MTAATAQVNIKANLDISQAKGQIDSLESAFKKLSLPKGMENSFNKVFSKMKGDIAQVEALMQKGLTSKADVNNFNKYTNNVSAGYSRLLTMINQLNGQKVTMKVDNSQIDSLKQKLVDLQQQYNNVLKGLATGKDSNAFGSMLSSIEKVASSSKIVKGNLEGLRESITAGDFTSVNASLDKFVNGLARLGSSKKIEISKALGLDKVTTELGQVTTRWNTTQNNLFKAEALQKLVQLLTQSSAAANTLEAEMNETAASINKIQNGNLEKVKTTLQELGSAAEKASQQQQKMNQQAQQNVMYQYDKQMQVNDLRMQVQYFFGLQNMIRLFRRGVSDAINTVKELDKAMTATAVVTDFSVGDMWGQLPEYTKRAQQLGTTIADMYNATTLYYQQGLDTEHAMGTAVETLKMARIAGIEGAEATDLMTAALRGFRMESNEANASHVNDVYSALAANSASNTYEIGTAMSKVASLASSANMDLETTATFLAQIIETTREAPETAGTALKTIIARFGEVKKLGENGLLTGTDEEGEVIDINKVDTALKTAGISLQDFINGNEGLDQVFLRLAERWGTLSVAQQRYIATQAAGARMQARFIAMMQDYGRTQELLGIATNAEGAGEKQYGKVAESLETKLNQLKDAYHSFIMGIANSSAIKGVVDALTTGFNAVNSIIQKVSSSVDHLSSGLGGVVKAALSLGTAFAALKIGGKVLNTGVNFLGSAILGRGAMSAGKDMGGGIIGAKASRITAPILSRLDTLISLRKTGNKLQANTANNLANKGETLVGRGFLNARKGVNTLVGEGTTTNALLDQMGQYSSETQRAIMATSPGTSQAIRDSYIQAAKNLNLDDSGKTTAQSFISAQEKAFKAGKVDFKSYIQSASMASSKAFAQHIQSADKLVNTNDLLGVGKLQTEALSAEWTRQHAINLRAKEIFRGTKAYQSFDKARMEGRDSGIPKGILRGKYNEAKSQALQEFGGLGQREIKLKGLEKAANTVSGLGAGIASAGMALNAFSANLSSMGADRAAAAISALGSAFTTLGMTASAAGNILTSVGTIAEKLGVSAGAIGGVFAGIGVIVAGTIAAYKLHQHTIKKIRDEGKQVTKDYKKNVVEQRKSIKELSNGYQEYLQLRKGVDSKGNNVSLDDEQYQRYQDYTDKLIKMNGALQQGVNETGKAYVSQYADIQGALSSAAKEAEQDEKLYLTNGSGQSIIDQVKTYKRIKKLMGTPGVSESAGAITKTGRVPKAATRGATPTELEKQATSLETYLKDIKGYENQLQDLGLGEIDFGKLNVSDAKKIYDKATALSSYIESSDLNDKAKANAEKAVTGLTKIYDDAVAAAKPQTDWLEAYLESTNLGGADIEKKITSKFSKGQYLTELGKQQASLLTGGFRQGLEQLSLTGLEEGWSAADFAKNATNYANSLKELTSSASKGKQYSEALKGIATAQKEFDNNILKKGYTLEKASEQYKQDVANSIGALNQLEGQYREAAENGDSAAGIIAEGIHEGMLKAAMYAEDGAERVAKSLNSLSGSFDSANAAIADYEEKTKDLKDFYTAAEGMKSILEDVGYDYEKKAFTGKDAEGHGSQKFWLAAENLVDEKVLDKGFDHVKKKMAELAPMLKEGKEGYDNFISTLHDHYQKGDIKGLEKFYTEDGKGGFDIKVDDSNLSKMANLLGMSDDLLSSMINKSRQFMDWDLSNIDQLATSLQVSEGAMGGGLKGEKSKFYSYEQLKSEGLAAGLTGSEVDKLATNLENKGVKVINIEELTKGNQKERAKQQGFVDDLVKSYGFKKGQSIEDYVKPFVESGQYSAEQTAKILQKADLINKDQKDNVVEEYEKLAQGPEGLMADTADNTGRSADLLAEILSIVGQTPQEVSQGVDDLHKKVFGEKGVDTKAQHYGHGENEKGEQLSYKERVKGLTDINSQIAEAEAYQKHLEKSKENASDAEKAVIEAAAKKNQETLDYLNKWKTFGSAGITTAEQILGGKAENFQYAGFYGEEGNKALQTLDKALSGIKDLDFRKLIGAMSEAGLSDTQRQSVLGQYSQRRFDEAGVELPKNVDFMALGQALAAGTVDNFVETIKKDLPQLSGEALETFKNQFAEYRGWGFGDQEYWDLTKQTGSVDVSTKEGQTAQKILEQPGFNQEVELVFKKGNAEEIENTLSTLASDADRIRVIDSMFNLQAGNDTEANMQTIQELTGLSEEQINTLLKINVDNEEPKKAKEEDKKDTSSNHKIKSDNSEVKKDKEEDQKPTESKHEIKADDSQVKEAKEEAKTPTESPVTFTFGDGADPSATNPLLGANGGSPAKVETIFEPKTEQVEEKKESIKSPEPDVKVNFVPETDRVNGAKASIEKNPIKQTVTKSANTTITYKGNNDQALKKKSEATKNGEATITYKGNNKPAKSSADAAAAHAEGLSPIITIGGILGSSFTSAINSAIKRIKEAKAASKEWTGRNNHRMGAYSTGYNSIPLNSYASGKKRTTKGNTMSALTGELGPELAWYPKEGRAEILGVGGPQYVPDLPKDSIIWNARQTDEILRRKSIPIESYGKGHGKLPSGSTTSGTKKTTTSKNSKDSSSKSTAEIAQTTGKISSVDVGIYNLTKKIEATSHKIEKNSDAIKTKLNKTIDFSYSQIKSLIGDQSTQLTKLANQNTSLSGKYTDKLNSLDKGTGKYKKYEVSYEKKGKKTTKNAKKKINLGKYVSYDSNTGAYQVNEKALNDLAKSKKGGKKLAEAVLEAAKKEIDDLTSKQLSADKAAQDAKNKLQELRDELKETLFAWENELTEIKDLETKISLGDSFSKTVDGLKELVTKMASPDLSNLTKLSTDYLRAVNANIEATRNQINLQRELRDAYKAELKSDLDLTDEYNNLTTAKNQLKAAQNSKNQGAIENAMALVSQREDELDAAQVGKRLLSTSVNEYGQITVSFDWDSLEKQRVASDVNKTAKYEAVKKYYEKVVSDVEKINDTNAEIANKIGSLYEQRNEQYQLMSDYTQKIREGMEEEEQKTIDNLSDLNKSIQDAFKDLIDKVKKELDRQHKAEQNQKDEEEISNKVNRLAMLRADTAGSNAAEIAQLEKELSETTGKYEDSLEDQLLDRLQDQADEAAKQREKQIELLTAQLKYSKSAGIYLAKAEGLVEKISNGTATSEELKLAQLYYLSSDKLLDKWGKELEKINFASETLKVENFNSSIEAFEQAIKDYQKAAEKLLDMALSGDSKYVSQNLAQIKKEVENDAKNGTSIKKAYDKLKYQGGLDNADVLTYLKNVGYTPKDFKDAGYSASDAKTAGFNASQLKNGGYTGKQIHDAGYTVTQFKDAKYSATDAKKAGYTAKQVRSAYPIQEFKKASYSAKDALSAGYSRKEVINTYGAAAVKKAEAGSTKTATLDKNGKKKGGKLTSGTVNSSGIKVAKQSGGAIYVQKYNINTGKGTGATKKVAFKDFNTNFIKQNQTEAGKELVYQLKNKKVGTKLHKNWKAFVNASTYSELKDGTQIALKGTKYDKKGTLVKKSGNVHYHDNTGVKYWNPTSGKLAYDLKYNSKKSSQNKNAFLNQALKNSGISREYAQFLIHKKLFTKKQLQDKGVKQFKTGGLADFTGPAWLDGTPSKPELVLNSTETKNFVALKDVLSEATKRGIFNHDEADNSGDINLDIDINVDKIDSDYDVDQIANRVKKIIIKEAKTRNVTVTGRAR